MSDGKGPRIKQMRNLALDISAKRRAEKGVVAVLLFGSVVKRNIHLESDVDIVIIKDTQENVIRRNESIVNGVRLDLWEHSLSFYENLFKKDWQPTEMFRCSLFLNILQECEVLYDKNSKFNNFRKNALQWKWPRRCKDFINHKLRRALNNYRERDYDRFEKLVYLRKLFLLNTCRELLGIGKPVSIRNKDLYLKCKMHLAARDFETVFSRTPSLEELELLVESTLNLFHSEVKGRGPWTELKDAQNYISNRNGFMAAISLQNGAYYLGGVGLSNRSIKRENRDFLYPESEIELILKSKKYWKEFYDIYRKVHNVDAWNDEDIDSIDSSRFKSHPDTRIHG